jgi:hypothetical protein
MHPSSTSIMAASEVIGLVIEAMRKMLSGVMGAPVAGSRTPQQSS